MTKPTVTAKAVAGALGAENGDYLTLANAWATVHITREHSGPKDAPLYFLSGTPEAREAIETPSLAEAASEALRILTLYQEGRGDR